MITVQEGRKAYNAERVSRRDVSLEIYMSNNHEAAVAAFFAQAETERPEEFARVCEAYPVLTKDQLDYQRDHELHAFGPEDDLDDEATEVSLTTAASMRVYQDEINRVRVARLRGEPV